MYRIRSQGVFDNRCPFVHVAMQAVYEAGDRGVASSRLFFTDFTKEFDLIDHITDARAGQTRGPSCPPEMDRARPS